MTAYKPNFKRAYIQANEILVSSRKINEFPFAFKTAIQDYLDVSFCSYKKAKIKYNIDASELGSESAVFVRQGSRNIIFYNQEEMKGRIRFSMGHETGHIMFGHKTNIPPGDLYDKQEIEANYFSAQLLMPEQIIREVQNRGVAITKNFLIESFGVSDKAAEKRIETLSKYQYSWRSDEERLFDDIIVNKYIHVIDRIAPKNIFDNYLQDDYDMQLERDTWF